MAVWVAGAQNRAGVRCVFPGCATPPLHRIRRVDLPSSKPPVRHNLPVTNQACALADGEMLVSVTDPQGRITYANPAFVRISGYAATELLGQPHNIVRHPDMPEEAFRDMWHTVQSGRPWTGLVKNRCKNGDFYWVRANAAPLTDGEHITGYLSVRTRPEPAEVQAADALYARMRDEAASGRLHLRLRHGRLLGSGPAERLRALRHALGPAGAMAVQVVATGAAALAGWALAGQGAGSLLTAVAVVLGVAAAAAWALQSKQMAALRPVLAEARRLSAGDLVQAVSTGAPGLAGEVQQALAQLAVNLRALVSETRRELAGVRGSVQEIKAGNLDLSARTEAQASSLQQTTSAMARVGRDSCDFTPKIA